MTYLSDLDTTNTIQAKVITNERITPNDVAEVRSIMLKIHDSEFSYREGQHLGVIVPGPHQFGHEKHFRLYTIANSLKQSEDDIVEIELCVRRCFYIDEFSGEEEPGIASNFLCDLRPGESVILTGPYGEAFALPTDPETNVIMIGSGTGIAPFRAFIQHLYQQQSEWKGQLLLFYGARSGTETLYRNEINNDLDNYYDQKTFRAFEGLSKRPWMHQDEDGLHDVLSDNAEEIWQLMQDPQTHVYLAGLEKTKTNFEQIMQKVAGSNARWRWMTEEMKEQQRWSELLYS
jgi:ferredoxin--NADP+ reductase